MFLHTGSDRILLYSDREYILPFKDIDQTLSTLLVQEYKKSAPDLMYVTTGPWSFTNLRVWILTMNMLRTFGDAKIMFLETNKIDLYIHLYEDNHIPRYILLYIGQRKNIRRYDLQTQTHIVLRPESLDDITTYALWADLTQSDYTIDNLVGDDFSFLHQAQNMISYGYENSKPCIWIGDDDKIVDTSSYFTMSEQLLTPRYGIGPNLGDR